jgi:hypothetical protein
MIVAELTLVALAYGINQARDQDDAITVLSHAREARAAQLHELRDAAAQVAMIGEYYHLTLATYGGVLCGLAGTAAVVAAFAWPQAREPAAPQPTTDSGPLSQAA